MACIMIKSAACAVQDAYRALGPQGPYQVRLQAGDHIFNIEL